MAKRSKSAQPPVRKSFLVFGGIVIGVAVLGFVVSTFVLGGGGGGDDAAPAAPVTSSAPAGAVPNTDGTATDGGPTSSVPKNELTPGGRNPFSRALGGGSTFSAASTSATSPVEAPVKATKTHTWQMLELESGDATILVDGKKKIVAVGETLIEGYTFNSITGKCVTVKGSSVFGLCPGAAPITL
jgi:hypothetical protein